MWYWLSRYAWTYDEWDEERPVKRYPGLPYQRYMVGKVEREPLLVLPKSRKIMASWSVMAVLLHDAGYHEGRRMAVQAQRQTDANELLERAVFIWEHLPPWLRTTRIVVTTERIRFPDLHSEIRAVPKGADILRQYTFSRIFSDELAHQDDVDEMITAAMATIRGGGQFIGVSSVRGGTVFEALVKDEQY